MAISPAVIGLPLDSADMIAVLFAPGAVLPLLGRAPLAGLVAGDFVAAGFVAVDLVVVGFWRLACWPAVKRGRWRLPMHERAGELLSKPQVRYECDAASGTEWWPARMRLGPRANPGQPAPDGACQPRRAVHRGGF